MSNVIPLPVRRHLVERRRGFPRLDPLTLLRRGSWLASWDVDDWGRDDTLAQAAALASRLRWSASIGGLERLPAEDAGVVVVNSRRFMLTPWFVALTLSDALERPVRFVGRPDVAPVGALARRLGGLLDRPDEVAGALRDGELLVIGMSGTIDPRGAGRVDARLLGPAVELKAPVFPAAVATPYSTRSARIEIGPPVAAPRRRRELLAEDDLARLIDERVAVLLRSFGDARTGTPLDWIPFTSFGGGA